MNDRGDGKVGGPREQFWQLSSFVLHSTAMSSLRNPKKTASTRASPPTTDRVAGKLKAEDGTSSKVSNGGNLRVRNFLVSPAATELTTNGTSRATSRARSREPSISRENSPSVRLSRRHPSLVYPLRGSA